MPTNVESFERALETVKERVKHHECPCCDNATWNITNTYALSSMTWNPVSDATGGIQDHVPDEFTKEGPDVLGLDMNWFTALAFTCTWCGYVRFHYFREES